MSHAAPQLPPLSAVGTRGLAGHLGHLSDAQTDALAEFKVELAKEGFYTPATETDDASHDEPTLLRFLRARKFDVPGAFAQFTTAENWRRDEQVAVTYDEFPVPEFKVTETVYPQWTGRRDKAGLPVYVFKISGLTKEVINKYNSEPDRAGPRMIALYEHMVQFALPFCSSCPRSHEETPVSATTTIVDISNVSLSRFWSLRSHMQRASTLATAMYAETLGTIYIVGAPNFFSVVWGWIGKWFDPGTVEKIFILKDHEVLSTLSRFIDPENIPKQFGGELNWAYGDVNGPTLDMAAQETLGLDAVPRGSVRWIHGKLVVKGTGRTPEEPVASVPRKQVKVAADSAGQREEAPVVANGSAAAVAEPVATLPVTASGVKTDVADGAGVELEGEEDHDIWAAAREDPAAPVKDLAATLEGTTL